MLTADYMAGLKSYHHILVVHGEYFVVGAKKDMCQNFYGVLFGNGIMYVVNN